MGDQAYRGQTAVIRQQAPAAKDFVNRRYRHRGVVDEAERAKNRTKSKVRAKVEHAIGVIKRIFGFTKVRYRGLKKKADRLLVTCALANLFMARRHRCAARRPSAPAAGQHSPPPAQHGSKRRRHPTLSPAEDVSVLLIQTTSPSSDVP